MSTNSRREFVAGASVMAAGMLSGASILRAAEAKKTVGFALVGIGKLTAGQLLPAFKHCKVARPVALVSAFADKARHYADQYGVNPKNIYNYENFDSIRENPEIDVVYVVLPNSMHAEYTIRAAKAGKHVLCEKPMATSAADCRKMIEACREAKRKLMIGYRLRYEPHNQKAIELYRSGEFGTIKAITAAAGFSINPPNQWRLDRKLSGGGSLMDIGIYALNACRYLSGEEPAEVTAVSHSTPNDPRFAQVEETILFDMKFPSGLLASCMSTYGYGCNRFRCHGTKGAIDGEPFLSYEGLKLFA